MSFLFFLISLDISSSNIINSLYLFHQFPRFFSWGFFSHEGPTRKQMEGTTFTWNFYSEGFSDKDKSKPDLRMVTQVHGPGMEFVCLSQYQTSVIIIIIIILCNCFYETFWKYMWWNQVKFARSHANFNAKLSRKPHGNWLVSSRDTIQAV